MSKSVVLMLVLGLLATSFLIKLEPVLSSSEAVENSWVSKAPMHQARAGLGVAAVNGKIYAIGGTTASGSSPPDIFAGGFVGTNEMYYPETDTWTYKASMPTPRDYFAIAAYGNKIYCIGGAVGFTVDELGLFHSYIASGVNEVYDTVTDTWETKTPWAKVGMKMQAHVVNGKIYVMDGSMPYVYDPENDSWATKTRMPKPYPDYDSSVVSAAVDNKIVVTFEFSTFNSSTGFTYYEQKVLIYDTETDSWSGGTSGSTVVLGGAAVATSGVNAPQNVYVLGLAREKSFPPSTNQIYDPKDDAWTTATAMPTRRKNFGVAVLDDSLYAIGGQYTESQEAWLHGLVTPIAVNEVYMPVGYGTVPPVIDVASPVNQTYNASSVSLDFSLNKPAVWMGYSFDGRDNVTVNGNVTIEGLSNGLHNVTVYARDELGNTGVSETIKFSVEVPFPTELAIAASVATVAFVGAGLLLYFKKRKH
jgi:N-acetylneuraminic acid mutarotase